MAKITGSNPVEPIFIRGWRQGSAVFPAQCFHDYYMYGIFTKVTPGNWTLTVSLQIGGTYYETGSVSEPFARTLVQGNNC